MTNPHRQTAFRTVAPRTVLRLAKARRLVVIAPHPDDETLGCGSLIARAARTGVRVGLIALTDGDASHPGSRRWPPAVLGRLRRGEQRRAMARLGSGRAPIVRLGWGDGRVAAAGDLRRLCSRLVALRAGVVLVTSDADHHPDHQAAARLARAAAHRLGLPLLLYAVWSRVGTPRREPDRYRAAKRWAVAAHRSQVGGFIADDPAGFRLSPASLTSLIDGAEHFYAGPARRPAQIEGSGR